MSNSSHVAIDTARSVYGERATLQNYQLETTRAMTKDGKTVTGLVSKTNLQADPPGTTVRVWKRQLWRRQSLPSAASRAFEVSALRSQLKPASVVKEWTPE